MSRDTDTAAGQAKRTVLLVEDDNFVTTFLAAKLEENYNTVVVTNTDLARQALKQQKVDLIVLDIMIPPKDGFAFLKEVKSKSSSDRHIPVVVLSNFDDEKDIARALKLGAVDFLVKANYVPADIVEKISKILQDS